MSSIGQITGITVANSAQTFMGRVYGNLGTLITQATISTITYIVNRITEAVDGTETETETGTGSLTVASVVFDTLQTSDPRWTKDTTGYNFLGVIPASCFAVGDQWHRVDIEFTPVSGEPFVLTGKTKPIATSV